jgi:tetratricopeptide (TPR) repeat protein
MQRLHAISRLRRGCFTGTISSPIIPLAGRFTSSFRSKLIRVDEELQFISEYKEASALLSSGSAVQAIPLLQRCKQITNSTLKQDPMYTFAVSKKLTWAHRYLGDYASAAKEFDCTQLEGSSKLFALQSAASSTLQLGDVSSALLLSEQCIHLSEDSVYEDADLVDVFYPSYGIYGLCHLFQGEVREAEEYLIKSARWSAGDLTAQMISGNNLGEVRCRMANYLPVANAFIQRNGSMDVSRRYSQG